MKYCLIANKGSLNNGHYVSYIRSNNETWYCFDENKISVWDCSKLPELYGVERSAHGNKLFNPSAPNTPAIIILPIQFAFS